MPEHGGNETDWSAAVPLIKSYSPHRSLDSGKTSTESYELSCWDGHSRKLPEAKLDASVPHLTHSAMHICMSSSLWQCKLHYLCFYRRINNLTFLVGQGHLVLKKFLPDCVGTFYFFWPIHFIESS